MGTPRTFNNLIQKELNVFAAWMPIVNPYNLGDYGIFSDGVFSKLGNISDDFRVTFQTGEGNNASIDFTSDGVRVSKFAGETRVNVIPSTAVNATIAIEFSKEKSFLVKSPTIMVSTIADVQETAKKLRALDEWDGKWKVVYQVYNAKDAVVISTIEAGTEIKFSGKASDLGQMALGSAGVDLTTNKTLGLKINGQTGVIGLGLFRVKSKLLGGWKVEVLDEEMETEPHVFVKPDLYEDDI